MPLNTEAPILIDLRTALTDEVIAEALPHKGKCRYSSPCIIGAMMGERRAKFSGTYVDAEPVRRVVELLEITFPEGQLELAEELQEAFDDGQSDNGEFLDLVCSIRKQLAEQVA